MNLFEQFDALLQDITYHQQRTRKASLGLAIPLVLAVVVVMLTDFSLSKLVILGILVGCIYMLHKGPRTTPEQSLLRRFKRDDREISEQDYEVLEEYLTKSSELREYARNHLSNAERITFADAIRIWKAMRDNPQLTPKQNRREVFNIINSN